MTETMKEKIAYEKDVYHKVSPDYIKRKYDDGILIWVSGSGGPPAKYRVALEYQNHIRYLEKGVGSHTANQAMILGAVEAVKQIKRPDQIYLVCPTELGFLTGLKGKGPNADLIQELLTEIADRDCKLTEVYIKGGGEAIREYLYSVNPNRAANPNRGTNPNRAANPNRSAEAAQVNKKVSFWKERNYEECLEKVVAILEEHQVASEIIEEVRAVRAE